MIIRRLTIFLLLTIESQSNIRVYHLWQRVFKKTSKIIIYEIIFHVEEIKTKNRYVPAVVLDMQYHHSLVCYHLGSMVTYHQVALLPNAIKNNLMLATNVVFCELRIQRS